MLVTVPNRYRSKAGLMARALAALVVILVAALLTGCSRALPVKGDISMTPNGPVMMLCEQISIVSLKIDGNTGLFGWFFSELTTQYGEVTLDAGTEIVLGQPIEGMTFERNESNRLADVTAIKVWTQMPYHLSEFDLTAVQDGQWIDWEGNVGTRPCA